MNIQLFKYEDTYKPQIIKQIALFFGFHASLLSETYALNEGDFKAAEETLSDWLLPPSELFVITYENKNVGFLRLAYRGANVAWIEDIFVDPQYRNGGIATEAIRLAEEMIKMNPNYTAICFDVVPRNEAALRLYHKLGYDTLSIVTVRKELYENKRDRKLELAGVEFKY